MSVTITVADHTNNALTPVQLFNTVWALNYQALYHYNRSPWVEHGYSTSVFRVKPIEPNELPPANSWHIELLETSDQEGALGYHENQAFDAHSAGPKKASLRSSRGVALHPATQKLIPLAKVFVATSRADGVEPSEVASHEMLEMLVDPYVANEKELRKYLDAVAKEWYIGEVCDPVQEEGYRVGDVPETTLSNFVYPRWFGQAQTRPEFDYRGTRKAAFELATGGYMSVEPESGGEWTQIYGRTQA